MKPPLDLLLGATMSLRFGTFTIAVGVFAGMSYGQAISVSQELAVLRPSDIIQGGAVGKSTAAAGDYVVIGSYGDDDLGSGSGSATVFHRASGAWSLSGKLLASDGAAGDEFGKSVAFMITQTGGTLALVGADQVGIAVGAAYVYQLGGLGWTQSAKLTPTAATAGDVYGRHVAASAGTLVVSAQGDDDNGSAAGAVYVYTKPSSTWTVQAKLEASDGAASDQFGGAVAIDGDRIVVGAPFANKIYIFERGAGWWTEVASFHVGSFSDDFGTAVAIEGDVIAATKTNATASVVHIYKRISGTWTSVQQLSTPPGADAANFGSSLAIGNGWIHVGSPIEGNVFTYGNSGSTWTKVVEFGASSLAGYGQGPGWSIAAVGDHMVSGRIDPSGGSGGLDGCVLDFHRRILPYGVGCPGTGGLQSRLTAFGEPVANGNITIRLRGGLPNATGLMFVGNWRTQVSAGYGCSLLVGASSLFSYSISLDANGDLDLSTTIPSAAAGLSITQQAFLTDAGTTGGFSNSNGLEVVVP